MIVAAADIARITGLTRPSAQVRWLTRHRWQFTVNALGEPVVALAEFNRHMVGGSIARRQEPDFRGINGTAA